MLSGRNGPLLASWFSAKIVLISTETLYIVLVYTHTHIHTYTLTIRPSHYIHVPYISKTLGLGIRSPYAIGTLPQRVMQA